MSENLAPSGQPAPVVVSVIIPCYNAAKFLAAAVQSVLEQKIADCEILIINDGSTDNTAEVIRSLGHHPELRVLTHPGQINEGVCTSRRLGIREARGEFVAFLDSDDAYLPGKLARHIALLRQNPGVVLVHTPIEFHSEDSSLEYGWNCSMGEKAMTYDLTRQWFFLRRNMIANSTVVCRRSAIFPDDLPKDMVVPAEDWVIWNSMATRGLFHFDPEPLTSVLVHTASYTSRLTRWPGTTELRAIEFYLSVITRLPGLRLRLRALFLLGYYLFKLAKIRAGTDWRPGFFGRFLEWIFGRMK